MWKKRDCRNGTRDAFKTVHFVSRLFGLAPYSFVTNPQKKEETIDISWKTNLKSVIWSLIMLTVQLIGLIYAISSNFIHNADSLSELVARTLQFPLINSTGLFALALSVSIRPKKMLKIVETLWKMEKYHSKINNVYYKKHNVRFTILATISIIYHITVHSVNSYFYPRGHINFYYGVSIILCDLIWFVNNLQYVNTVEVLTQNLILMNKNLHNVFVSPSRSSHLSRRSRLYSRKKVFCLSMVTEELYNRDHSAILNSQKPVGFRKNISSITSTAIAQIMELRVCFNNLYQVCRVINSMYGLSLLMDFMAYTVCLIGDVYVIWCILITPYKGHKLISVTRATTALLWVIASSSNVFSIAFASFRANNEFKKTLREVQKLILRTRLKSDVQEQLNLFSIQLVNNKIEFTACGFFDVNFKLLRTLVYVVTTYIILLVQVTKFN
ncbi:hypothetical protein L798_12328 [Zootermopsis nevadensis]|uniref:Gustatory receptor n=1 Tax=Zootermopsis nevadensis TaxID=136037 RepID=A0A067QUD4_ZOONE|nr:hypothetical protein L798_12328 [Zootermopsis nevadensis]